VIIEKLHAAVVEATQRQQVKDTFTRSGVPMTVSKSPADFRDFVNSEIKRWARIIKEHNIKLE
jgi:tripartite-type tricarboxylate transporter receptor subunit TctC